MVMMPTLADGRRLHAVGEGIEIGPVVEHRRGAIANTGLTPVGSAVTVSACGATVATAGCRWFRPAPRGCRPCAADIAVVTSCTRATVAPATSAPKGRAVDGGAGDASASEKCVVSTLVAVNWRFSSSGVEAPGNTSVSPVAHVTALVVCTTAGLAADTATTTCASLPVISVAPLRKRIAVGEFQRDRVILLEVEFDLAARRAAAGGAGMPRAGPPGPCPDLDREGVEADVERNAIIRLVETALRELADLTAELEVT
jgi:hypothetical protein